MSNPIHIPAVFAEGGIKNPIEKTLQSGQDQQDATWVNGWGGITMVKIEDGGKAPKGQDFNGVLNALGAHTVFNQNGGRYQWSQDVIDNYGGYAEDSIIQSDDGLREYRSLIDNNTVNPNNGIGSSWLVYAGAGSVPNASSTTAGIMPVINNLTSTAVGSALSAAQGRVLNAAVALKLNSNQALGFAQSWQNLTTNRANGVTYTNNTGRPIQVWVSITDTTGAGFSVVIGGVTVLTSTRDLPPGSYYPFSFIVPNGSDYRVTWAGANSELISWSELR